MRGVVILDLYHDPNRRIAPYVFRPETLPSFVKEAADVSKTAVGDKDYALVVVSPTSGHKERRYPINDAGNTFWSALYFHHFGRFLPEEMYKIAGSRVAQACKFYGLQPPPGVANIPYSQDPYVQGEVVLAPQAQEKSPVARFLEKQASFDISADNLTPFDRRAVAKALKREAEQLGLAPGGLVEKYAQDVKQNPLAFKYALQAREFYARGNPVLMEKLAGIAALYRNVPPEILAMQLAAFDKLAGLDTAYSAGLPDPVESSFGSAIEVDWIWTSKDGVSVTQADLEDLVRRPAIVRSTLKEPLATQFLENPVAVFDKLPVTLKTIIAKKAVEAISSDYTEAR